MAKKPEVNINRVALQSRIDECNAQLKCYKVVEDIVCRRCNEECKKSPYEVVECLRQFYSTWTGVEY